MRIHYVINPRLQATHTKGDDLKPLKNTHHSLAKTTPRMLILIPSRTHNTSWKHQYKNTIIKKERNIIHLDKSQDQRLEYKTQSYSTLEMIQKTL